MASLILVSDMDGTLLDDSSRIPPENIAAIRELIAAGGGFTIATGRPCAVSWIIQRCAG